MGAGDGRPVSFRMRRGALNLHMQVGATDHAWDTSHGEQLPALQKLAQDHIDITEATGPTERGEYHDRARRFNINPHNGPGPGPDRDCL